MKVGTRSVLFGVHAFWWHPLTVALAWRRVHRRWPNWWESICIAVHDLGYWGCADMDGPQGKLHPQFGAMLTYRLVSAVCWLLRKSPRATATLTVRAYKLTLYHSSSMAKIDGREPSALYLPDKVSILHDPDQFYLLRARLSGELAEYVGNSPMKIFIGVPEITLEMAWLVWYCIQVEKKLKLHEENLNRSL